MLKYIDNNNVFSFNIVIKFFENISINKYIIKVVKDKKSLYKFILSLNLIKFEILKPYIKI